MPAKLISLKRSQLNAVLFTLPDLINQSVLPFLKLVYYLPGEATQLNNCWHFN